MTWTRVAAAVAATGVCLASVGSAQGATGTLRFSPPSRIAGAPYTSAHQMTALDCVATTLCVGGDEAGNLITTTNPTSGASAWTVAEQVDPTASITAVSCPSKSLCVAAGDDGAIIHSTNPTGGSSTWKVTRGVLADGDELTSLSCPSARLCVGVDRRGDVVSSRDPTGSARAWKSVRVLDLRRDWLIDIVCPATSECVALDRQGHGVLHTNRPTGGRKAWILTTLNKLAGPDFEPPDLACASISLCVIIGTDHEGEGDLLGTSTHPTGGRSAWHFARPKGGGGSAVSCPSTSLCVLAGGDAGTTIAYSTHPAGGAATYSRGLVTSTGAKYPGAGGLSCASATQCVVFASPNDYNIPTGQVVVTNRPMSTSTSDWPVFVVDGYNGLESVSCPSATVCVAGGTQMAVHTTANPTGGAAAWSATPLSIASDHVSCGATNECAVGDATFGDLAATSTPLSGGWVDVPKGEDESDEDGAIGTLACTAGPFCIAGVSTSDSDDDTEGTRQLTTTDPTGSAAWAYGDGFLEGGVNGGGRPAGGVVTSLTCASPALCVAGDAKGGILTNTTPSNVTAWHYTRVDGTAAVEGLACPSASLCVGVDSQGRAIHSTHPTAGEWSAVTIDKGFALTAVSCPATSFCVAVDGHGDAFESTQPTGPTKAWRKISGIDGDLTSIACPTTTLCVAVDSQGNEVTGSG